MWPQARALSRPQPALVLLAQKWLLKMRSLQFLSSCSSVPRMLGPSLTYAGPHAMARQFASLGSKGG